MINNDPSEGIITDNHDSARPDLRIIFVVANISQEIFKHIGRT